MKTITEAITESDTAQFELERLAFLDNLPPTESPQLIRPRVIKALFDGLESGAFPYGYFKDEKPYYEQDKETEAARESWKKLIEKRHGPLTHVNHDYHSYMDGLRVGRILMDLQAKETVGEITVNAEDINSYSAEIQRDYAGYKRRFHDDGQEWFRDGFSGKHGLEMFSTELEQVGAQYEKYRWPEDRWQIRMGIYDAYMLGHMKIYAATQAEAAAPAV